MFKLLILVTAVGLIKAAPTQVDTNPMHAGLFEGDIVGVGWIKGLGHVPDTSYDKWPKSDTSKAVVPYEITGIYSTSELAAIDRGLKAIERQTATNVSGDCIKFVKRTTEDTWLNVIRGGGCWSWVGKQRWGGSQDLSIGNGCAYDMIVAHEFMHALGIWHEQSRPDRDDYVTLNLDVVDANYHHNFNKYTTGVDLCRTRYDLTSIMHYENTAFSNTFGAYSIIAKDGTPLNPTWQKSELTKTDVACLREYYGCN